MRRLTEKEEEIMTILWELDRAFVHDILNKLPLEERPPYNTVSSIIRKLVSEGLIGYEAFGKTHQYYPILKKEAYRTGVFQRLLDNYFDSSPAALLSFFVKEQRIEATEIDQLLLKIKENERS
jgi:BlaI family transcriptional regulator, penicillinase repressor